MAISLHVGAFEKAKELIAQGRVVNTDKRKGRVLSVTEECFLADYGVSEYGKWFLGIDSDEDKKSKKSYKFPYGDFMNVHRSGLDSAKKCAAQIDSIDIEDAADELLNMIKAKGQFQTRHL